MKKVILFLPVLAMGIAAVAIVLLSYSSASLSYAEISFNLENPLAGQPTSLPQLIGIVAKFIFNIAIPISVLVIIYGGFMMLTSGGKPEKYKKGLDALKFASIGLAVLLIAKGFVSLVQSILSVK